MNNKYLEKIAAFTALELGSLAALGGYAADKGDGTGGAVAGMLGGTLGHHLGHKATPYVALGVANADAALRRSRKLPMDIAGNFTKGFRASQAAKVMATVGGAYGAARAYSKLKHPHNHE